MTMNFDLLIDFFNRLERQGPGSDEHTKLALKLSGLAEKDGPVTVADIGCGTGASTLVLASELEGQIIAVDLFDDFLKSLTGAADKRGLSHKIETLSSSMEALPFSPSSLDGIWSEGAIYNMGFEKGISYFRQFLKPGGILAVSEITWLTEHQPEEIRQYWTANYPEIASASQKIAQLERNGFCLKGYFPLPKQCWDKQYYDPMENHMDEFLNQYQSDEAEEFITEQRKEIALYRKFHPYYSYGFYIAEKIGE